MAATYDFSVTRNQIIRRALRIVNVVAEGEDPTGDQMVAAAEALNAFTKALQNEGILDWTLQATTLATVIAQVKYALTSSTFKLLNAYLVSGTSTIPLDIVSAATFDFEQTTSGTPTMVYFNPTVETIGAVTGPTVSLKPTPSAVATINLRYVRKIADFDTAVDVPEAPQAWFDALAYGLASHLADEYAQPPAKLQMILQKAEEYKARAFQAFNRGYKSGSPISKAAEEAKA